MKIRLKILESKFYLFKISIKRRLFFLKNRVYEVHLIEDLLFKYAHKKRIVVLCNGPSANLYTPNEDALHLVTNSGNRLVADLDFLYYVNDPLYIQRILANYFFLNRKTDVVFYYTNSVLHRNGLDFLIKNISLLSKRRLYFVSSELSSPSALRNYDYFISFYKERDLQVKVQNSGVFILLLGYFLAQKLKLPFEIYGLDMGEGGKVHFDGKGVIGNSVTEDRVKKNVKIYLDFMYNEYSPMKNHSYFNSNLNR